MMQDAPPTKKLRVVLQLCLSLLTKATGLCPMAMAMARLALQKHCGGHTHDESPSIIISSRLLTSSTQRPNLNPNCRSASGLRGWLFAPKHAPAARLREQEAAPVRAHRLFRRDAGRVPSSSSVAVAQATFGSPAPERTFALNALNSSLERCPCWYNSVRP